MTVFTSAGCAQHGPGRQGYLIFFLYYTFPHTLVTFCFLAYVSLFFCVQFRVCVTNVFFLFKNKKHVAQGGLMGSLSLPPESCNCKLKAPLDISVVAGLFGG